MAKNANGVGAALDQVKDAVAESGHAVAAHAVDVKDQVAATAALASDKAGEAVQAIVAQLPSTSQEWETLAKDVADNIRKNPRPWIIAATAVGLMWLLGRRRSH